MILFDRKSRIKNAIRSVLWLHLWQSIFQSRFFACYARWSPLAGRLTEKQLWQNRTWNRSN